MKAALVALTMPLVSFAQQCSEAQCCVQQMCTGNTDSSTDVTCDTGTIQMPNAGSISYGVAGSTSHVVQQSACCARSCRQSDAITPISCGTGSHPTIGADDETWSDILVGQFPDQAGSRELACCTADISNRCTGNTRTDTAGTTPAMAEVACGVGFTTKSTYSSASFAVGATADEKRSTCCDAITKCEHMATSCAATNNADGEPLANVAAFDTATFDVGDTTTVQHDKCCTASCSTSNTITPIVCATGTHPNSGDTFSTSIAGSTRAECCVADVSNYCLVGHNTVTGADGLTDAVASVECASGYYPKPVAADASGYYYSTGAAYAAKQSACCDPVILNKCITRAGVATTAPAGQSLVGACSVGFTLKPQAGDMDWDQYQHRSQYDASCFLSL